MKNEIFISLSDLLPFYHLKSYQLEVKKRTLTTFTYSLQHSFIDMSLIIVIIFDPLPKRQYVKICIPFHPPFSVPVRWVRGQTIT